MIVASLSLPGLAASAVEDWGAHRVFYFYAPSTAAPINLDMIGVQDDTNVWLLNITGGESKVLSSGTVDRMKILTFLEVRHEGFYKLVADKPVIVVAYGSVHNLRGSMFYPATSGPFVGREFFFKTLDPVVNFFAVEQADITVYGAGGAVVKEFKVPSAGTGNVTLEGDKLYRATSTGDIMVSIWVINGFTASPSLSGSFVGRTFYARPVEWPGQTNGTLFIFAYADCTVTVADRGRGSSYSLNLRRAEYSYQENFGTTDLVIDSTGDVAVWAGGKEVGIGPRFVGDDVTYVGGREGREFWFEALHRAKGGGAAAVIFTWKDTEVKVNGTRHSLKADGYLALPEGYYHVESDSTLIVEVLAEDGYFNDWSTTLMSPSDATVDTSQLPSPSGSQETPLVQYGAALAVVVAILVFLVVKRRRARVPTLQTARKLSGFVSRSAWFIGARMRPSAMTGCGQALGGGPRPPPCIRCC